MWTHQVCFGDRVSKPYNHYGEEIGAGIWENPHRQSDDDTGIAMDCLELTDGLGPNPLVISVLHGLELDSLLRYCFLNLREKICMGNIFGKYKIGDYGGKARDAAFEDEKIRPDEQAPRWFDLKHPESQQSAESGGDDSPSIEYGNARGDFSSSIPLAQIEDDPGCER
jgi:hypothetical protein